MSAFCGNSKVGPTLLAETDRKIMQLQIARAANDAQLTK
jgi:hypothetical protein